MQVNSKKIKAIKVTVIVLGIIAFQAWDLSYNNIKTVIDGSFRADSLFTAAPSHAQTVAVIASDNSLLSHPVSVTSTTLTFQQIKSMVKQAIDLVGGISRYVQSGDTVLIKPNIVGAKLTGDGENTDIRVVKSIISIIYDAYGNSCKIFIGEGSARNNATMGGVGWVKAGYNDLGSDADLAGINFELVDLNDEVAGGVNLVYANTKASLAHPLGGKYWIHKFLVSPNIKYIDVPVLKMHEPGITCVLKNQIGIAAGAKYGWNKMSGGPGGKLVHHAQYIAAYNYKSWQDEEIADLSSCLNNFTLCVVDALMCLETQKTLMAGGSNQVRLNTIIAGADPVAVDHVCTKIMGINPDDVAHLTMAEKIGLGTNNADSITVAGENIGTKYTRRFLRGTIHNQYGQGNRVWLVSQAFPFNSMATHYISNENAINPSKGDVQWSAPIYFFDDRIDLNSFLNPTGNVVSYCFTNVYSPTAKQNVELWLNSEEDMMVYLNGESVYNYSGSRPNTNLVTDKPLINLKAGENRILVKVLQRTGCYDFALNICEPGTLGNRVEGLKFYIKNYNEPAALIPSKLNNLNADIQFIQTRDQLLINEPNVAEISIYNLKGIRIKHINDNKITITTLSNGVYIANIRMNNGSTVSRKFVK
ncbi:MAG TPA: DUF362 domain-containing protein [Paludibacter sp.]|nr:DUF362 domain-containing protein [Paludibacter sp.]